MPPSDFFEDGCIIIHIIFCKEDSGPDSFAVGSCCEIACFHGNAVNIGGASFSDNDCICCRQSRFCKLNMNIIKYSFQTEHFTRICFECSFLPQINGIVLFYHTIFYKFITQNASTTFCCHSRCNITLITGNDYFSHP